MSALTKGEEIGIAYYNSNPLVAVLVAGLE